MAWKLEHEYWHLAKEIRIYNGPLRVLPCMPICNSLVKLVLQTPRLEALFHTFFLCMPQLKVLDLSKTSIRSLPITFSCLRALEEFFCKDCPFLMELPKQIGDLTKLKLLDTEGTGLIYIPQGIEKLADLECMRISFAEHADHHIIRMGMNVTIIPRLAIQKLTKLKELCISVVGSEGATWWEEEVTAVQGELSFLKDLHTLKWHLPTNDALQQFVDVEINGMPVYARLSNFMLTIGEDAQVGYSLPFGLDTGFLKFRKCLKCLNGGARVLDISKIIASAEALFLFGRWNEVKLPLFNIKRLKYCLLVDCYEMQTVVVADNEKVGIESLQYLDVNQMNVLQRVWRGPIRKDSLSRLRVLALNLCPVLTNVFTQSLVENLVSLTELTINDCPRVKSLISREPWSSFRRGSYFPSLKKIYLIQAPALVSIFDDLVILPQLESMFVYKCPKLGYLYSRDLPNMKEIKGEREWWNALKCDKSRWNDVFVPLGEEKDVIGQLIEATKALQHFHNLTGNLHP